MASVARGRALVAKLRANPKVKDPEALAAWLGRVKKLKRGGLSTKAAMKAARGGDSSNGSSKRSSRPESERQHQRKKLSRTKPPSEATMRANRMEEAKRHGWSKQKLKQVLERDLRDLKKLQAAYKRRRASARKK